MADAVTARIIYQNANEIVVHMTCISDGTLEAGVKKVDVSALTPVARTVDIKSVRWCVQGFSSVRLLWDATTDDVAMVLSGSGYEEFEYPMNDPESSGYTGDLMLTSVGGISGSTYDITVHLIKRS